MDSTQIIAYALALGIAAAIAGPGMIALVARSLSGGAFSGFALLTGIVLGDLVYLSFAVFGLALIAQSFHWLFVLIKWGSVLYLTWLGWQFWSANTQRIEVMNKPGTKDLLAAGLSGLSITLGNPKTIAFYLALLPLVIDLQAISLNSWATTLIPLTVGVLLIVGAVFVLGAVAIRRGLTSARAQQAIYRGAGAAMFIAAGTLVTKEL